VENKMTETQRVTLDDTVAGLYGNIINTDNTRRKVERELSPMARTVIDRKIKNPDDTLALDGTEGKSYNLTKQAYDDALQGAQPVNTPEHYAAVEKQYLSNTDVIGKIDYVKELIKRGVIPQNASKELQPVLNQLAAIAGLENSLKTDKEEDILESLRNMGISDAQRNLSGLYHGDTLKALAEDIYQRKTREVVHYLTQEKKEGELLDSIKGAVEDKEAYAIAGAFAYLHYEQSKLRIKKFKEMQEQAAAANGGEVPEA